MAKGWGYRANRRSQGQIAIDGENDVTYESMCRKCERELRREHSDE